MTSQKLPPPFIASEESEDFVGPYISEQAEYDDLKTFRKLIERQERMAQHHTERVMYEGGAPFSAPRMAVEQPDQFMQQQNHHFITKVPGYLIQDHLQPANTYFLSQQPHAKVQRMRGTSCPSNSHRRPMVVKTNKIPDVFTLPVSNVPASAAAGLFQGGFQMAPTFQPQCLQIYNMQNNVIASPQLMEPFESPFVMRPQVQIGGNVNAPSQYSEYLSSSNIPHVLRPSQSDGTLQQQRPFSNRSQRITKQFLPPRRKVRTNLVVSTQGMHDFGADQELAREEPKIKAIKKKNDKFMGAILMNQNKAHLMKSTHYFAKKKKSVPLQKTETGKKTERGKSKQLIDLSHSFSDQQLTTKNFRCPPAPFKNVADPRNAMKNYLENSKRLTPRSSGTFDTNHITSKELSSLASRPSHSIKCLDSTTNGSLEAHKRHLIKDDNAAYQFLPQSSDYFGQRRISEPSYPVSTGLIQEIDQPEVSRESSKDFTFTFSPKELSGAKGGGELKKRSAEGDKLGNKRKKVEARPMDLISEEKEGEEENQ